MNMFVRCLIFLTGKIDCLAGCQLVLVKKFLVLHRCILSPVFPVVVADCGTEQFSCGSQTEVCMALELVCDGDCDCDDCLDENDFYCGEGRLISQVVSCAKGKQRNKHT